MRLRLRIQRNELPTVNTLWPVSDTQLKQTIVQLLEQVNGIFPLESDTWGLEHYTVSIGDYECLHYHELGAVCKDEDEIVIRPLQYVEVRARTLLGRDQIAPDGRHLHDGVPWGRPLLRRAIRPLVHIPPRKRRRLDEELDESTWNDGDEQIRAIMEGEGYGEDDLTAGEARELEDLAHEFSDSEDEDDDEDDFAPDDEDAGSSSESSISEMDSSGDDSSSDASSDSDSEGSLNDGKEQSFHSFSADESVTSTPNGVPQEQLNPVPNVPKVLKVANNGIPFQGKAVTQQRNARRRDQKKLKHLVAVGELPVGSGLRELNEWWESKVDELLNNTVSNGDTGIEPARAVEFEESASERNSTMRASNLLSGQDQEVETRRQELLDAIASGGIDVMSTETSRARHPKRKASEALDDDDGPPEEVSTKPRAGSSPTNSNASDTDLTSRKRSTDPTDERRSRLIFGALGVRAPKTDSDKQALQKKLAGRKGRNASTAVPVANGKTPDDVLDVVYEAAKQEDEDPEAWREKIELSAVECMDEGVTYPEPPFPFRKHWHNKKVSKKKRNKQRDAAMQGTFVESYDKYNMDGSGDALNYDDEDNDGYADDANGYWDDNALLEDTYYDDEDQDPASQQLLDETDQAQQPPADDFPILPPDVSTLPTLIDAEAEVDDYIVFNELACSVATGWQPKMLTLTARLRSRTANGAWEMVLAQRDLQSKTYDDEGNRVYAKFEMEGLSDDDEEDDDRGRVLAWSQMDAPRLLLRPEKGG